MGREIEPEPGDYPDPVVGYACDPVQRICTLLTMIALFNVGTFVMMTASMALYFKGCK